MKIIFTRKLNFPYQVFYNWSKKIFLKEFGLYTYITINFVSRVRPTAQKEGLALGFDR